MGFIYKNPRLNEIQLIIDKAHIIDKSHVLWQVIADEIPKTMNYYWLNIYWECEEYLKELYEWQTNQKHKIKQRVVKYI